MASERVRLPGLDVVVVGAASRDVTPDDPRGWRLGGSAAYCSLALARLGLAVGCLMGMDAEASKAAELELLTAEGVDLRRLPIERGPVFENIERAGHRRQRWQSTCDRLAAGALPAEWRAAGGWLLVPVAGELGEEWAGVPGPDARVAVGWQGLLREFAADGWVRHVAPAESLLLRRAGLVCASVDDLEPGFEIARLRALAGRAAVVLTDGAAGGLVVGEEGLTRYSALEAQAAVDPTGGGDVFLAGLIAAWLLTGERATGRALRLAAAAGSCVVEGVGLAGVPTRAQVVARLVSDRMDRRPTPAPAPSER
jgi:sugar/nucleoside kinase (ribokinase family)